MTALEFLKLMSPKTYDFIMSDNPKKTPQFYKDILEIVLHQFPWAKNHIKGVK